MPTKSISSIELDEQYIRCCVCIDDIKINDNYISCSMCNGCDVCSNCSISMLENGLLSNCPICRQENWYKYPVKNVDEPLYIEDTRRNSKYTFLNIIKKFLLIICFLGVTWQMGLSIMAMTYNDYIRNMNIVEGLILFVPGAIGMSILRCCYKFYFTISIK